MHTILPLKDLHLAARYDTNVDDLVDILERNFKKLLDIPVANERLEFMCHQLFYEIISETRDLGAFFSGKKSFSKTAKKFSFTRIIQKLGFDKAIGEQLDMVAFKIADFAFCFGNEHQLKPNEKLFGDWPYRSPQMLFMQKGQLWLLNFINNTLKWCRGKDINEIRSGLRAFIKKAIDLDFSPYLYSAETQEVREMAKSISDLGKSVRSKYQAGAAEPALLTLQKNRSMGFELECQVKHGSADVLAAYPNSEEIMLQEVFKMFKRDSSETIRKVSLNPDEVIEHGTVTRDASNIRYPGYLAFEYSSPVCRNGLAELKENTDMLCQFLDKNGGGLVREDSGTHLHISIEDLLPNESDSDILAKEKIEAIKRIFINYILLQEKIESILPIYRRGDNSWYSGQPYQTYVKGDKDFIMGLIESSSSYEELKDTLMVGGKYLSLAPFSTNIEFRSFPATTNPETLKAWFELLHDFVESSIKGLPPEQCINPDVFERLQFLTKSGTVIDGKVESQDICFDGCNRFDSALIPQPKVSRILEYAKSMTEASMGAGYGEDPKITEMSVSMDIERLPGKRPHTPFARFCVQPSPFLDRQLLQRHLERDKEKTVLVRYSLI